MSQTNRGKKRSSGKMLDYDAIKKAALSQQDYMRDVRENINFLKNADLRRLFANGIGCQLSEVEALTLLTSKLSVTGINRLQKALDHVPSNINRVVNGESMRVSLILKIVNSSVQEKLTYGDLEFYVEFIQTYCPVFLSETDEFR